MDIIAESYTLPPSIRKWAKDKKIPKSEAIRRWWKSEQLAKERFGGKPKSNEGAAPFYAYAMRIFRKMAYNSNPVAARVEARNRLVGLLDEYTPMNTFKRLDRIKARKRAKTGREKEALRDRRWKYKLAGKYKQRRTMRRRRKLSIDKPRLKLPGRRVSESYNISSISMMLFDAAKKSMKDGKTRYVYTNGNSVVTTLAKPRNVRGYHVVSPMEGHGFSVTAFSKDDNGIHRQIKSKKYRKEVK